MTGLRRRLAVHIRRPRRLRRMARDLALGMTLFIGLATLLGMSCDMWSVSPAAAADHLAAHAIAATSPPGPGSENAVLGAVLYGARPLKLQPQQLSVALVGLTFTVLFAFNLALWRHLRRVSASARRRV